MLETPEARAKLRRKLETWPDDRKCPVTINQALELLDMVERLDKVADMLACFCADLCPNVPYHINCQSCDNCPGGIDCKNSNNPEEWRKLAKKMVEETNG